MALGRLLLVALLAAGCAIAPALEGTSWRVVALVGVAPVPGSDPRISFAGDLISGHIGCNTSGGRFRMDGNRLILSDLGMTAIGCPGAPADQEEVFVRILGGTVRASITGDRLTLASEAGRIDWSGSRGRDLPFAAMAEVAPGLLERLDRDRASRRGRIVRSARRPDGRVFARATGRVRGKSELRSAG